MILGDKPLIFEVVLSHLPYDMSNGSISTIRFTITVESSTSFEASSSVQVAVKPSPATSRSAQG
jgi:hypothetical protein